MHHASTGEGRAGHTDEQQGRTASNMSIANRHIGPTYMDIIYKVSRAHRHGMRPSFGFERL